MTRLSHALLSAQCSHDRIEVSTLQQPRFESWSRHSGQVICLAYALPLRIAMTFLNKADHCSMQIEAEGV